MNVKLVVRPTENASATNDARVEFVNHFAVETMIVAMVRCVKTSFVQLVVDQTRIAPEIWLALVKNVLIHVKIQTLVDRMPIVLFKII